MRSACLAVGILLACSSPSADKAAEAKPSDKPKPAAKQEPKPAPAKVAAKDSAFKPNDVVIDHDVKTLDGTDKKLSDYRGKALLVVNTASQCGYTPQYADLQEIYAKYRARGLEVLAFPSNDFGQQEPGTPEEIQKFVDSKYDVQFSMFEKVKTKGDGQAELYKTLTEQTGDGIKGEVQWNFTKFLVSPDGKVVARFEPKVKPNDPEMIAAIEANLPKAG